MFIRRCDKAVFLRHNFLTSTDYTNRDFMDEKQRQKEKRETPIADGDARPDMPLNPESKKDKKRGDPEKENKFESERLSDTNSLEDYKDAKEG